MSKMVNKQEFAKRRQRLIAMMRPNSIAVLPNAKVSIRNGDVHYHYRSNSNFYYLSGFNEPESVIVIIPKRSSGEYLLFCRDRDPDKEMWDGYLAGQQDAIKRYGADNAYSYSDLDDILPKLLKDKEKIYYSMGIDDSFDKRMMSWLNHLNKASRQDTHSPHKIIKLEHCLNELRLFKSGCEIKAMRHAAKISARAHIRAMQFAQAGKWEYQVEAEITHEFMKNNCREPAYSPIVGGGKNGCTLHYIANNCKLKNNDLLLIDAGAEYDHYAADISRTFPVNGQFTASQKALYTIVLNAQKAAIAEVKPGNHCNRPHEAAVHVITEGLLALGLLKGKLETLIKREAYRDFYMHRTGHWLGMDVHDVGDYKTAGKWRILAPGMVLTVEPGIYIRNPKSIDKKWHFNGIRIEDDVLVTKTGHDILSKSAPKEIDEIEALMAEARQIS